MLSKCSGEFTDIKLKQAVMFGLKCSNEVKEAKPIDFGKLLSVLGYNPHVKCRAI